MHVINDAMKNRTDYDKNTYYLFIVSNSEGGSLEGIMPYRENFGYIFANTTGGDMEKQFRAIAHELGHGAFGLEHNFSERGTQRSKTPNLMDYSKTGGTFLRKYQWEFIHNPKARIFGGSESEVASAEYPRQKRNGTWILHIYSPDLSTKFEEASFKGDLYRQRTINQFARTHHFDSGYGLNSIEKSKFDASAQLFYAEEYFYKNGSGVYIVTYSFKDNDPNTGVILRDSGDYVDGATYFFPFRKEDNKPADFKSPVDVFFKTDFYGSSDFRGSLVDGGSNYEVEGGVVYNYTVNVFSGYIAGWGYNVFESKTLNSAIAGAGVGADNNFISNGEYLGDFIPTPANFVGYGSSGGLDLDIFIISGGVSFWKGFNGNSEYEGVAWKGYNISWGSGLGVKVFGGGKTFTEQIFPLQQNNIFDEEGWMKNYLEKIIPYKIKK